MQAQQPTTPQKEVNGITALTGRMHIRIIFMVRRATVHLCTQIGAREEALIRPVDTGQIRVRPQAHGRIIIITTAFANSIGGGNVVE